MTRPRSYIVIPNDRGQVSAVLLVAVFAVLLPVTITATWAHRTVVNTGAYVATITPIAASPAVQTAVSREITNEIYAALHPQQIIVSALPPKAAALAGPLSNGVKGYLQDGINKILASPKFQRLWVAANRFAHAQLITVLEGDSKALQATNGQVVLNLVPLLNEALKDVQARASALLGRNITLPAISGTTVPAAACQKIATAIGRPLPPTCGQIPLFKAAALASAQRAYQAFNRGVLALVIVTPLVFLGALWASPRRRRTLLQLTIGGMLGLIAVRRVVMWLQSDLIAQAKPANRAALSVITGQVFHGLFTVTWWFLIGGLILVVVALLSGPYRWAVAIRSGARRAAQAVVHLASALAGHASSDAAVAWIGRHLDLLRIGGAVAAALVLLIFPINWAGFLVIAALFALYEYGLHRLRQPQPGAQPAPAGGLPPPAPAAHGQGATASPGTPTAPGGGPGPGSGCHARRAPRPLKHRPANTSRLITIGLAAWFMAGGCSGPHPDRRQVDGTQADGSSGVEGRWQTSGHWLDSVWRPSRAMMCPCCRLPGSSWADGSKPGD